MKWNFAGVTALSICFGIAVGCVLAKWLALGNATSSGRDEAPSSGTSPERAAGPASFGPLHHLTSLHFLIDRCDSQDWPECRTILTSCEPRAARFLELFLPSGFRKSTTNPFLDQLWSEFGSNVPAHFLETAGVSRQDYLRQAVTGAATAGDFAVLADLVKREKAQMGTPGFSASVFRTAGYQMPYDSACAMFDAAAGAPGALPPELFLGGAQKIAFTDPQRLFTLLNTPGMDPVKRDALLSTLPGAAMVDPEGALAALRTSHVNGGASSQAVLAAMEGMANSAPEQIIRNLDLLPDTVARGGFAGKIITGWVNREPWAASESIRDLPPSEVRDAGAAQLVAYLAPDDPEAANVWLNEIRDPTIRQQSMEQLAKGASQPILPP